MLHAMPLLSDGELLGIKCWNTPTIYNGWEQITKHDRTQPPDQHREVRD
jgi:hypothetical protein